MALVMEFYLSATASRMFVHTPDTQARPEHTQDCRESH